MSPEDPNDSRAHDGQQALTPERAVTAAREAAVAFSTYYAEHREPSIEAVDALASLLLRGGDRTVAEAAVGPLFTEVVEPLADSYDDVDRLAMLTVIARLLARTPEIALRDDIHVDDRAAATRFGERLDGFGLSTDKSLLERVQRVARPRRCGLRPDQVRRVFLLSRITIGADVLLNGLALARLRREFSDAEIVLIGPAKNASLFAGAERVRGRAIRYPRRGRLFDRFFAWLEVLDAIEAETRSVDGEVLVVNLDSRLLQSGLLPVLDATQEADRYFHWDPTAQPDRGDELHWSLADALARWLDTVFGRDPDGSSTYPEIHLDAGDRDFARTAYRTLGLDGRPAAVTVNLGVGGNDRKRVVGAEPAASRPSPSPFELRLVFGLLAAGRDVVIDRGFQRDEVERVVALAADVRAAGHHVVEIPEDSDGSDLPHIDDGAAPVLITFQGSVTRLAALIGEGGLYVGYDSVGPHLAGALGRDLIAVFAGYDDPGFPDRWRSAGPGAMEVLRAGPGPFDEREQERLADRVLARAAALRG